MAYKLVKESARIILNSTIKTFKFMFFNNRMTSNEAHLILGTKPNVSKEDLEEKYRTLFARNDESVGGSPYFQKKIKSAYFTLINRIAMTEQLHKRVKRLTETEEYKQQRISQEGYGSLIPSSSTGEDYWAQAESLRKKIGSSEMSDNLSLFVDVLCLYIRAQSKTVNTTSRFITQQKHICIFVDEAITCARRLNKVEWKSFFKWILFNLRLHLLFKQNGSVLKQNDPSTHGYVLQELGVLEVLFSSSNIPVFEVVQIDCLEKAIRTKYANLQKV